MEQQSGQQWFLTVLLLQLTPQLVWCGPTEGVQPHDCPPLLVFRASTTNSELISPSHCTPTHPNDFFTLYSQLYSTLNLVSSSLLAPLSGPSSGIGTWIYFCTSVMLAEVLATISAVYSLGLGVNCHMDHSALKSSSRETGPHLIRLRWIINN